MTEFKLLIDLILLVGMAIPIVALAHRASIPPPLPPCLRKQAHRTVRNYIETPY